MGMEVRRFEVFLISLDPTKGHEIKKTRPCVVISPDEMNRYTSTVIVASMTSKGNHYPTRIQCQFQRVQGQVILDQIRTINKSRIVKKLGSLSKTNKTKCYVHSLNSSHPKTQPDNNLNSVTLRLTSCDTFGQYPCYRKMEHIIDDQFTLKFFGCDQGLHIMIYNNGVPFTCRKERLKPMKDFLEKEYAEAFKGGLKLKKQKDSIIISAKNNLLPSISITVFKEAIEQAKMLPYYRCAEKV